MKSCVYLSDVHRQLKLLLLSLWGREFVISSSPEGITEPYIKTSVIFLPRMIYASSSKAAKKLYFSAAIHAAAHQVYSIPVDSSGLNNRQKVLISLIEDARVELLADLHFPGILSFLKDNFNKTPTQSLHFNDIAYGVAHALLTKNTLWDNPVIKKAMDLFNKSVAEDVLNVNFSRSIGLALANDIGQMRISMNERDAFTLVPYRDDNAYLWNQIEEVAQDAQPSDESSKGGSVTGVRFREVIDGKEASDFKESEAPGEGLVFKAVEKDSESLLLESRPINSHEFWYPEWDYKIDRLRQPWCRVHEYGLPTVPNPSLDENLDKYRNLVNKLHTIIHTYQYEKIRKKRQEDGRELDLDAIIECVVDLKMGASSPDNKIYIESAKHGQKEFVLLILIDLSESMNDTLEEDAKTVLGLTVEASIVLSLLLDKLGCAHAIYGFNSNGRQNVHYFSLKEFNEKEISLEALLAVKASYSTRLGAALRHSFSKIALRKESHKHVLLITDGQPSDIDVFDQQHLIEDSKKVVSEAEVLGYKTFCLSLDKDADQYVKRIFRKNNYLVVDNPKSLTKALTTLYLRLFKSLLS